jgi:hypothetical protein
MPTVIEDKLISIALSLQRELPSDWQIKTVTYHGSPGRMWTRFIIEKKPFDPYPYRKAISHMMLEDVVEGPAIAARMIEEWEIDLGH